MPFRCVYLLYTSEYTVHKKIPAKFYPCMQRYTLSTAWFDYKMFSSAKEKKKELNITTWNEPTFTSCEECFFKCSTEVPLMRQSVVMYQKRNIP